jgi:chaperone modulatory protein CbpM
MTKQEPVENWIAEAAVCRIEQLVEVSGLSQREIEELIEDGVIAAGPGEAGTVVLQSRLPLRSARRLRDDFELDRNGLALALALLRRIEVLEAALGAMRARLGS